MRAYVTLALLAILLFGCSGREAMEREKVFLNTTDQYNISAFYYKNGSLETGIILLHMLGDDKRSWDDYAPAMQARGYDVLTMDLRGHGESQGNHGTFGQSDYNRMTFDVRAGADYLREKGNKRIYIIGASIGANVGLKYSASDDIERIVLLSPGIEYRWVNIEDDAKAYGGDVLIVVSSEDEYSSKSSSRLKLMIGDNAELWAYEGLGHGTDMLSNGKLLEPILEWLGQDKRFNNPVTEST